jgi:hypothetical protein
MTCRILVLIILASAFGCSSSACECGPQAASPPCARARTAGVFAGVVTYASPSLEEQQAQGAKPINPFQTFRLAVEEDLSGLTRLRSLSGRPYIPAPAGTAFGRASDIWCL